ncbi:MAG TPA: group 1 truncated hemoglobin [Saprospiraceae bacterium]|jgi:hemoglobin
MEATTQSTLFTRIGGMGAVNAAVDIFYGKVLQDDRVNHFFRHIDMEKQSGKLKAFMAYAFGAPLPYSGKALREAHQHMHLQEDHFNAVAEQLVSTLKELNVAQGLIDEVVTVVLTTKNDVLNL